MPDGMWLDVAFDQAYLKVLRAGQRQTGQVTPEGGRILLALDGEMSRAELMTVLSLKDEKHFRTHYRQAALAAGVLEMTVPDKPQSRHQKYRLTASGRQWITCQNKP